MQEGQDQNQAGWVFSPDGASSAPAATAPVTTPAPDQVSVQEPPVPQPAPQDDNAVHWTASEYIARQKNPSWFVFLVVATLSVAAVIFFITRDILSVIVVLVIAVVVGMLGAREPQARDYAVSDRGVSIGPKLYPFVSFKSFSILHEDAMGYVSLMPTQRFMPPLAMYYAPEDEDKIVKLLADFLPYEERDHDFVERLSRKARF